MTAKLIYVLTEQSYSSYSVLSVRPKSAASQRSSHETSKVRLEGHETQCLALLSLETIRLCCVIPDTSFLLSVLPSLWGAVQVHLGVLFPDKDVREALLKTLDIYDVYPYSFMSYQSSSMSLGAQGLEIRFRILSSLDAIREAWETQQAEILRKADEV